MSDKFETASSLWKQRRKKSMPPLSNSNHKVMKIPHSKKIRMIFQARNKFQSHLDCSWNLTSNPQNMKMDYRAMMLAWCLQTWVLQNKITRKLIHKLPFRLALKSVLLTGDERDARKRKKTRNCKYELNEFTYAVKVYLNNSFSSLLRLAFQLLQC